VAPCVTAVQKIRRSVRFFAIAESPRGSTKLERDRRKELESYTQSSGKRFADGLGRMFTGGPTVDPEKPDASLHAGLDAYRRSAYHERFLDQLLASSPSPDVVWDAAAIRRSVSALTSDPNASPKAQRLVSEVCARSTDSDLQVTCLRAQAASDASSTQAGAAFASGSAFGQ